jgi:2-C-methyl-D-erythritol 4-phosphate cytidylyltransferase
MLYSEIIAVCSEIHTEHIKTLCGQNVELLSVKLGGKQRDRETLKGLNAK